MLTIYLNHAGCAGDFRDAFDVMRELRPHIAHAEAFIAQAFNQVAQGYRLLMARQGGRDGRVVALVGYRRQVNLLYGHFNYVDDLVSAT